MRRINLQRFAEGEPEVNVDVNVAVPEDGEPETPPANGETGETATVNGLIFTQEQINEINRQMEELRSEMRSLWETQFNDWKSSAIYDLEARVAALEGDGVDSDEEVIVDEPETTVIETDEPPAGDEETTDEPPAGDEPPKSKRAPGLLW